MVWASVIHQQCCFTHRYHWPIHCCSHFTKICQDKRELILVIQMRYVTISWSPTIHQHEWANKYHDFEARLRGCALNLIQKETGPHHFQPPPQKLSSVSSKFTYTLQSCCMDSSSQSIPSEVFLLSQVTKRFHTVTASRLPVNFKESWWVCRCKRTLASSETKCLCRQLCPSHTNFKGTEKL